MDNNPAQKPPEILQQPTPTVSSANSQTPPQGFSNNQTPDVVKKTSKFSLKAIIGTIIFLLLAGGAAAIYINREPIMKLVAKPTPTPSPILIISPTPDPTTNWKTFYSENGHFEIKHPSEFDVILTKSGGALILNHTIVQEGPQINDVTECLGDCPVVSDKKEITLNGYTAKKIKGYYGEVGGMIPHSYIKYQIQNPISKAYLVLTLHEIPQDLSYQELGKKYGFQRSHQPIPDYDEKLFDQILSTFKFTDNQAVDTSNWKTYTNTKLHYSFKHPHEWSIVNATVSNPQACAETLRFSPNTNQNSLDASYGYVIVCSDPRIKTLDDYVKTFVINDSTKVDLQYIEIDGEKALSYSLSGGIEPLPIIEYVVVKDANYYIISLTDSKETNKNKPLNQNIFNQIVPTMKFTN